ncbi:DUF3727 domain-containing protein [Gloeobacter kilaueensis]|uniref:DUF3727 domain-containing protein n=1 Tax=Gloeobacter kilaueensis (strain ATCC BAA-2537 / CCAP 1431/1 / ULC 316 / JS1) TaxID=1183438 RepID=U5QLQ8_GLOK1|nr:DUF3727 domain-containing protein [Gloeobacter kilaueensis]AGY58554.1 hypothetical protein GKIL_2308 [Gloeobacter kilaueensis JS1]
MSDTLTLKDEAGRTLACELVTELEIDGAQYGLVVPQATPVRLMAWEAADDEDGNGEEEDTLLADLDDEEIERVFQTARAVLAEQDLKLVDSAYLLIVEGDIPNADEAEFYSIADDEDNEEEEEYQLLEEFFFEDRRYGIFTPLDPVMLFVELPAEGEPRVLEPEETARLMPNFEEALLDLAE